MEQRQGGEQFRDVDRAANPAAFVRYLDERGALDFFQVLEQRLAAVLQVRPGGRFLDVGCGTGDDVRGMAQLVGPSGWLVGVDSSATMVHEARQRAGALGPAVEFRLGDAHQLDFPDGAFDGCRVRRVLQHLDDPAQAVAEMVRVTTRGGRVVAYEPDWGTLFVDAADRTTTRRILELRCDSIRNGWIGRQLPGLFRRAGLVDIGAEPLASALTDYARGMALFELAAAAERARAAGVVSPDEVGAWLAHLDEAGQGGRFFAGVTGVLASGRKP